MKPKSSKPKGPEVWGLTGGVASGKSTAARFFAEAGIPVIDADQLARELSEPGGAAYDAIVKRFGTADRAQLRKGVFSDPSARQDLEAILHPLIASESAARALDLAKPGLPVIYEAALLVETGRDRDLAGLLVIDAPRAVRRERLIARNQVTPELADAILGAQGSDEARRARATVVIDNSGTPDELRERVANLIRFRGWAKS